MGVTDRGPSITVDGDLRVTRVGRFLRRWKLDELPQLWNVLRGDMSIIGPRPEAEKFVRCYREAERRVLRAAPGLAGMAALIYPDEGEILRAQPDADAAYVEHLMPRKLAVELEYEARRTFASDLGLMLKLALSIAGSRKYADREFRIVASAHRPVQLESII